MREGHSGEPTQHIRFHFRIRVSGSPALPRMSIQLRVRRVFPPTRDRVLPVKYCFFVQGSPYAMSTVMVTVTVVSTATWHPTRASCPLARGNYGSRSCCTALCSCGPPDRSVFMAPFAAGIRFEV
ncbi:hypothetical protein GY45DRAFT_610980 [Cubamyces sp. BRFM 1775]|nr:hypothetical protein GY45DRAFT_610980 [Cubamyces sp. BRFM 1775]